MNKFPRTHDVLDIIDKTARLEIYNPNFVNELGVELRELLKLVPQPKLREYKGVTYENDMWWFRNFGYKSISGLIMFSGQNNNYEGPDFTDDDFIPLMDLKNTPYVADNRPRATIQLATEEKPRPEQKVAKSWWDNGLKEDYEH